MARKYTRDNRGRFAPAGTSASAPKRLKFLIAYHGTSQSGAKTIKATGYRESADGKIGPGVYATRSTQVAKAYTYKGHGKEPGAILRHRVAMQSVHRVRLDKERKTAQAAEFKGLIGSGKAVVTRNEWAKVVLMSKEKADATLIRSTGIVRRRRSRVSRKP